MSTFVGDVRRTKCCLTRSMGVLTVIQRLRDEFTAMPGLQLTAAQAARLCSVDRSTSGAALCALVSAGFLAPIPNGGYRRTDTWTSAQPSRGGRRARWPAWERILCVVESDDVGAAPPTIASPALRYAAALAFGNRARVTALTVLSEPAPDSAHATMTQEIRNRVSSEACRELIEVRVTTGSPDEEIVRVARDIHADLIVLGRTPNGACRSSLRLPDILSRAACPVLIVHPSGGAAVA